MPIGLRQTCKNNREHAPVFSFYVSQNEKLCFLGNLGLKRKLEEQTSKTKDVKKRQKSTTTTEGGPSGGGEEAPSCSWQGDTSHVQPGIYTT